MSIKLDNSLFVCKRIGFFSYLDVLLAFYYIISDDTAESSEKCSNLDKRTYFLKKSFKVNFIHLGVKFVCIFFMYKILCGFDKSENRKKINRN